MARIPGVGGLANKCDCEVFALVPLKRIYVHPDFQSLTPDNSLCDVRFFLLIQWTSLIKQKYTRINEKR